MTNTTTSTHAPVQHTQTEWDNMPKMVQDFALAQGHIVVPDPVTPEIAFDAVVTQDIPLTPTIVEAPVVNNTPVVAQASQPTVSAGNPNDLFAQDVEIEEQDDDAEDKAPRIFLNVTIAAGKFEIKVKAAELTSDFHRNNYRDGKMAGENKYMASLISSIEKHGLAAIQEKVTITATLSASGEALEELVDIMDC